MSTEEERIKTLDISLANHGLWLVKVPKYVSERWERVSDNTKIAKIRITSETPTQKAMVTMQHSDTVMALKKSGEEDIPEQHTVAVSDVVSQTLGIFSYSKPSAKSGKVNSNSGKLRMEGKITQKLELCCQPVDRTYMKLKLSSIKKASTPQRKAQQLAKAVQNFKPVSNHKINIENAEKKKAEGKKMRDDKELVLNMLFAAFEKHQYYTIKDLVTITKQPVVYLKEILTEICNYNLKNPHRNMWELKPEYRYYNEDKLAEV